MTTTLGPLTLPNPVMTASGCAANGQELHRFFPVSELGAFVTKTVMAQPRSGRGTPRMAETASGMLNSIGLQGPGIDAFVEKDLPGCSRAGARALVSIAGNTAEEFGDVAEGWRPARPTTRSWGSRSTSRAPTSPTAGWSSRATRCRRSGWCGWCASGCRADTPIFAKLTPDVTDIVRSPTPRSRPAPTG